MGDETGRQHPLQMLDEADREFVVRFVLASGSLKEMAQVYGVSYPTIRARLDRIIDRLQRILEGKATDPMSELLANLVERGEITLSAARAIRDLSRNRYRQRSGERE